MRDVIKWYEKDTRINWVSTSSSHFSPASFASHKPLPGENHRSYITDVVHPNAAGLRIRDPLPGCVLPSLEKTLPPVRETSRPGLRPATYMLQVSLSNEERGVASGYGLAPWDVAGKAQPVWGCEPVGLPGSVLPCSRVPVLNPKLLLLLLPEAAQLGAAKVP
jgi:hypothetical protein